VRESPASKDVKIEAEGSSIGSCYQTFTGKDTAGSEDLVHAVVSCIVCELPCSYVL
jgi:hypothetical protein